MSVHQFGAKLWSDGHCEWRLWAPNLTKADVVLSNGDHVVSTIHRMQPQKQGFFYCEADGISAGMRYAFRLNGKTLLPDPASRWQPDGVHQHSAVWRAEDFSWTDQSWLGVQLSDLVIYELHVGTFTAEGTFAAIIPRLRELRELGITAIELLPVGQFAGERGWGYDGVYWFAVQNSYGGPTELQRLVDACHAEGLGVILDVIYNHLGPEGNYLREFGPFFTDRHRTPWGEGINYDDESSRPVRDFVLANVRQWIRDFHVDGLRLDAVHAIQDDGPFHILAEIKHAAEVEAEARGVPVQIIAESNLNDVKLLAATTSGGYRLDAVWNDDFHHCVHTLLTGEDQGYYADFTDPKKQLVKALNDVFVYDGCFSQLHGKDYGTSAKGYSGERFVVSIQTHDQVGNRALGDRFGTLLTAPQQRLAAGLLLLAPYVPLLFMGEEYGETRPFPFFCDFSDEALNQAVRRGRFNEFAQFEWQGELPDPCEPETFASAVLSWNWPAGSAQHGLRMLYHDLLSLRRSQPALRDFQNRTARLVSHGKRSSLLVLQRGQPSVSGGPMTILFNLSGDEVACPEKLMQPANLLLHSEDMRFGGSLEDPPSTRTLPPFAFVVCVNSPESTT